MLSKYQGQLRYEVLCKLKELIRLNWSQTTTSQLAAVPEITMPPLVKFVITLNSAATEIGEVSLI
jgi:hypothetical protein